jgi:hypothetical protein
MLLFFSFLCLSLPHFFFKEGDLSVECFPLGKAGVPSALTGEIWEGGRVSLLGGGKK